MLRKIRCIGSIEKSYKLVYMSIHFIRNFVNVIMCCPVKEKRVEFIRGCFVEFFAVVEGNNVVFY